jgi:hypothetical protein
MVHGGDPTYYRDPGQSVAEGAAACLERRLPYYSADGKRKVPVKDGDAAATLAERWEAACPAEA